MIASILTSVKKVLGLDEDYTAFDEDVILLINGFIGTLNQAGIGPEQGFAISDADATWDDFIGPNLQYNGVKNYICLQVRLAFDPPSTSFHTTALKEQAEEFLWRLNVVREHTAWVDPTPYIPMDLVLDGGTD